MVKVKYNCFKTKALIWVSSNLMETIFFFQSVLKGLFIRKMYQLLHLPDFSEKRSPHSHISKLSFKNLRCYTLDVQSTWLSSFIEPCLTFQIVFSYFYKSVSFWFLQVLTQRKWIPQFWGSTQKTLGWFKQ